MVKIHLSVSHFVVLWNSQTQMTLASDTEHRDCCLSLRITDHPRHEVEDSCVPEFMKFP